MKNQQLAGCFLALVVGYATIGAYAAESAREIAPGVLFEKNVAIPMRDGAQLMANIYRPKA